MKVTVSIPDDLWAEASPDDSSGPSETVQRALHLLRDQVRASRRPLANAPDQSNLTRYQLMFDEAVETTAKSVGAVLDNGYRFGLLVASGLTTIDFDAIDLKGAASEIRDIVEEWGVDTYTPGDFSSEFVMYIKHVLDNYDSKDDSDAKRRKLLRDLLGDEDEGSAVSGVRWTEDGPRLSDTFVEGVLSALRDVRDQATRHMTSDRSGDTEGQ